MATKWYDNKQFVWALLIAFFPAGLFGMWKSSCFSSITRWIVTSVFIVPILLGAFRAAYIENRFVHADAAIGRKASDEILRMGISYDQATENLMEDIHMEPVVPLKGQTRYRGTSKDYTVALEIIGNSHAITEAIMTIVPSGVPDIEKRNQALMHCFLGNIIPEWPESANWATSTLERFSTSSEGSETVMRGYKKVTMTQMKGAGTVTISVKHA